MLKLEIYQNEIVKRGPRDFSMVDLVETLWKDSVFHADGLELHSGKIQLQLSCMGAAPEVYAITGLTQKEVNFLKRFMRCLKVVRSQISIVGFSPIEFARLERNEARYVTDALDAIRFYPDSHEGKTMPAKLQYQACVTASSGNWWLDGEYVPEGISDTDFIAAAMLYMETDVPLPTLLQLV